MLEVAIALSFGFGFGFLLNKAGLTHYARIVNIYRLRDFGVMEFMLTALLVGAVLVQTCVDLEWAPSVLVPPTLALANLSGGAVFGVGMALAGYCPGTIVAEAGEGRIDAWLGGLLGLLVGAIGFGLMQPWLMPMLSRVGALGRISLAALLGANPWLVLLVFGELVLLTLVSLARRSRLADAVAHGLRGE